MPHYEAKGSHSGDSRTSKLKKNGRSYCSSPDYGGRIKESKKRATPFEPIHLRSRCPNPPDALKRARKFNSERPSFLIVVRSYYLEYNNVHVPSGFMKSQISKSLVVEDATLKFQGRSWTVKFFNYPNYYGGKFSTGWTMFAIDTSLSEGDVCVFELIKKNPMVFKVSIFRHAD
ncbi:B3 domain-containing protein REM19-like [Syzygium oleosum]|uniref:B3 domain-containing protein REM19-like n=1 Tax=Syzygium oleosum TaxID=219896 RepID=UPI0024B88F67|nr:B3 domain-containing protein REM19-like [Syzygium oleosum]